MVWAKHDRFSDGWLPLWQHMEDSAAVAGLLWDRWLPAAVRRVVAEPFAGDEVDARRLVVWLAGIHDVGKATPAFACQVDGLADAMRAAGLEMPYQRQMGADRRMAPHGLAGQLLLQEWLEERCGWPGRSTAQFAVVIGGHHGVPPEPAQVTDLDAHPELLRTPGASQALWRQVQEELLEACADEFGVYRRLGEWQRISLPQPVQVVVSAVVIVADWIASNPDLFPYLPQEQDRTGAERATAAWHALGLPEPWRPGAPQGSAAELITARFELPKGAVVRPVQEAAVRVAREMPEPGLLIVEAPMGEGKTEAALAAAEVLAARAGAGGVFFALPTMATSNAMFPRLLKWLDYLPAHEGEQLSVLLAHSKAALNDDFAEVKFGARVASVDVDSDGQVPPPGAEQRAAPAELVAHQWLSGRKKGMLASFVVGTVDQLLFAGLKSRHLALRHLALAGKVVVIDEAHAYDTYMNTYLDRVLGWLGAYRVPVVVLSATLPAERRRELAEAYAGVPGGSEAFTPVGQASGYPLLTAVCPGHSPLLEEPAASGRRSPVQVEELEDDLAVLAGRLEAELTGGGCVLVVRNTVKRVLETAKVLRHRFGSDAVTVAHARFLDVDRAAKDKDLLTRFGPQATLGNGRPTRHIVVASQVAEQSLDVDFDLLVTDLAPVDLLLQRMGRLHRHPRDDRPGRLQDPRCWVTGVDWTAAPPEPVRGSQMVYGRHALLRSLAVLRPHLAKAGPEVQLPQDISPLVQQAYGAHAVGPDEWAETMTQAQLAHERVRAQKARAADVFRIGAAGRAGRAILGWLRGGAGDADDTRAGRAQVRDSPESLEVVVVERLADGSLSTVSWAGGGRGGLALPTDAVPVPRAAQAAMACSLRLPPDLASPYVIDRVIAELEQFCIPAWQAKDSSWLAGELILPLGSDCQTRLAGFRLQYSPDDGLEVSREQ
ncbi:MULTISPECIES: CRISPR-associated helicase/endonuclease Cas3 [unclassified Streptomyces]|uniref:CRISPR-associated helicase/endonuclease Cas3 n=1 Tax=unclassified Streptomyces TaxID=2593676 RepID=UPI00035E711E|nr:MULTISPECIES: CRISPR-associated helicase/endonuclease Cas3 [unclassified Streptomyces]MYX39070.1 CRISPR-associated helicase/endonuclease Cas3 [Streptomyces sp. SID8377]